MDNKDKLDIINKVVQITGFDSVPCLYALREHNWDESEAIKYLREHNDDLDNFLRYNRYE